MSIFPAAMYCIVECNSTVDPSVLMYDSLEIGESGILRVM